jgi:DNA-binding LacI/PurR family transcriptional regulator
LLSIRRERIAFLGVVANDMTGATDRRLLGYQHALVEAGVRLDPDLVLATADFSAEAGAAAIADAIRRGVRFDGVLCRDDKFALGALKALHRAGLDVPGDVAVVGWDDTAITSYTSPTLTSISPDKQRLAEVALELLEERMNGFQGRGRHRIVPHSLTVRESAPAPSA